MWWSRPHLPKQTMTSFWSETHLPQLPHRASLPALPSFHHHCTLQIRGASARWWAIRQGHWSFLKTMKTVLWKQRAKVEEDSSLWGQQPSGSREVMENTYMTFPRAGPHGPKKRPRARLSTRNLSKAPLKFTYSKTLKRPEKVLLVKHLPQVDSEPHSLGHT